MIPQDRVRVVVSEFEENLVKSSFQNPRDYAIANAEGKAREVCITLHPYRSRSVGRVG